MEHVSVFHIVKYSTGMVNNMVKLKKKKKSIWKILLIIAAAAVLVVVIAFFVFRVTKIEYSGSNHYTDEELSDAIFSNEYPNSLFYFLFQRKNQKTIPFVQKYEVNISWPDKMNVTIYEKPIIGYVSYMGCFMYFDKDGIVVESSTQALEGVPQITGLDFKSIVLNQKLQVSDQSVFSTILEFTQAFDKYGMDVDKIHFDSDDSITLNVGEVKVLMGTTTDYTDRLYKFKEIAPKLSGLKGTLHLENYSKDTEDVIFKREN